MLKKYNQFLDSNSKLLNENVQLAKRYLVDHWIEANKGEELYTLNQNDLKLIDEDPKYSKLKKFISRNPVDTLDKEKIKDLNMTLELGKLPPEKIREIENNPNYLKLKKLLEKSVGWVYTFTVFHFGEGVAIAELEQLYKQLLDNRDLLDRLPQTVDKYTSYEQLIDDLENVSRYRKAKALLDELPGEVKREAQNASIAMKKKMEDLAFEFYNLKPELQKNFIKKIARYRTLLSLSRALETYIKASLGTNLSSFVEKVGEVNKKYGDKRGAEIVFLNEDTQKMIIEIRSWETCKALCSNTSWCIASSISQWNNYVGGDNVFTKQYIILDFSLSPTNNNSIIGVTVQQNNKFRASHLKNDASISESDVRRGLTKEENDLLVGMTNQEAEQKKRLVIASKEIKKPGITIDLLDKYLKDGADINVDSGLPLKNAIKENNYDKVKFLLDQGASVHLGEASASIIDSCVKDAMGKKIMLLLIEYGAEITRIAYRNHATDVETIKLCVDTGIDINFDDGLPLRFACRLGDLNIVKYIVENGGDIDRKDGMALQWASEYGRPEVVDYLLNVRKARVGLKRSIDYLIRRSKGSFDEYLRDQEEYKKSSGSKKEVYREKIDKFEKESRVGTMACLKLLLNAAKEDKKIYDEALSVIGTSNFKQFFEL